MYEYGQIGVVRAGGPTKLQFIERTDSWDLYIVNSNPYLPSQEVLYNTFVGRISIRRPIQFTQLPIPLPLPSFAYDMYVDHSDGSITSIVGSRLRRYEQRKRMTISIF